MAHYHISDKQIFNMIKLALPTTIPTNARRMVLVACWTAKMDKNWHQCTCVNVENFSTFKIANG